MRVKYHEIEGQEQVLVLADETNGIGTPNLYTVEATNGAFCIGIPFQNGPIPTSGINGVTIESLIAICKHRLEGFQSGPFPCRENAQAMVRLQEALDILKGRTLDRIQRQVEGKEKA